MSHRTHTAAIEEPYQGDLAAIHDEGFQNLALGGASVLLTRLRERGVLGGVVVDLGCGSGVTARVLADAGYDIVGYDLSTALIERARERVPQATFHVGSFVDAELPPCVAVAALGEVVNYTFDPRNGMTTRAALFAKVQRALAPGGVFLLDGAGPDRVPATGARTFAEGDGWAVLAASTVDEGLLTRRITSFRRIGADGTFRRSTETHHLELIPPEDMEHTLRACGFTVEQLSAYGSCILPHGLHGFVARKPIVVG